MVPVLLALLQASLPVQTGRTPAGLYWEAFGAGNPLVLVHAFSLDRRQWDPVLDTLARHFRVVRYDLRAHGHSAGITEPYAPHDDLGDVLDAAGAHRAVLVGLSSGAQLALDFTLIAPERVASLVLVGPGVGGWRGPVDLSWMAPVMAAARAGDVAEAARRWAATPLMAVPQDSAGDALMRRMVQDNAALWGLRANPARAVDPPAIDRLEAVAVPVLLVMGRDDLPHLQAVADTLAARLPAVRREDIRNAGHLVPLAQPRAFVAALLAFLQPPTGGPR